MTISPQETLRPSVVVALVSLIPIAVGGYMLFDGMHALLLGSYYGPGIGPWGFLVSIVGISPAEMAVPLIVQGSFWLFFLAAGVYHRRWAWYGKMATAIATLWYIPFGTILSIVQVAVLVRYRNLLKI